MAAAAANATATVNMMSKNQAAKATAAVVVVPPHSLGAPFSTSFFSSPFSPDCSAPHPKGQKFRKKRLQSTLAQH